MTAAPAPTDDIETALGAVAEQLQAGDVIAAAAAMKTLVALCQAAEGRRLASDQVARMQALLERCTHLAGTAEAKLNAELRRFSVGGRARKAYRVR